MFVEPMLTQEGPTTMALLTLRSPITVLQVVVIPLGWIGTSGHRSLQTYLLSQIC